MLLLNAGVFIRLATTTTTTIIIIAIVPLV
jgi:hypothetical protein